MVALLIKTLITKISRLPPPDVEERVAEEIQQRLKLPVQSMLWRRFSAQRPTEMLSCC